MGDYIKEKEKHREKNPLDQGWQGWPKKIQKVLISIRVPLEVWTQRNIVKEEKPTIKKINNWNNQWSNQWIITYEIIIYDMK